MPEPFLTLPSVTRERMRSFAQALGQRLKPGDTLTLEGEMGAGKTTFSQSLISSIAEGAPEVTSPTFALMHSYDVRLADRKATLWHLDLYRIEQEKELDALGLEELWPHVVLIEWPRIAASRLPQERLELTFSFGPGEETRALMLYGNDAWRQRLAGLV